MLSRLKDEHAVVRGFTIDAESGTLLLDVVPMGLHPELGTPA